MKAQLLFGSLVFALVLGCAQKVEKPVVVKSDALWNIINTNCVPHFEDGKAENQCAEVHMQEGRDRGYVVFKDQRGVLQYLLMPTRKIAGMESPELLEANSPNYFNLSWVHRTAMEKLYEGPIAKENISLAINSAFGRSQNQLHVHISCPKIEVQKELSSQAKSIPKTWGPLPKKIIGFDMLARRISEKELAKENAFHLMAKEIPNAEKEMGEYGLAMMALPAKKGKPTELVLLALKRDRTVSERGGSIEHIQDHDCPQLTFKKK